MHTVFNNPIHTIECINDGSNGIFDVYQTFTRGNISWVVVDLNEPMTTDDVYTKVEEVNYGRIEPTGYVTDPWFILH